jgi:hypothetical protein
MLTKIAEWSSMLGAGVGAVGLLFSVLAFWAAGRAKESAEAARREIRRLAAADKVHQLNSIASELFSHIEHEDLSVASFLVRSLLSEISGAITRWEFLDTANKERFYEAGRLTRKVGEFLRSRGQLEPRDKTKVLRNCDSILAILSGEWGKIQSDLEGRGES